MSVAPDSGAVTVHPPEMREPVLLALHHMPVALEFALFGAAGGHVVLDPSLQEARTHPPTAAPPAPASAEAVKVRLLCRLVMMVTGPGH